jgi:hypothetical protein
MISDFKMKAGPAEGPGISYSGDDFPGFYGVSLFFE